MSKSSFGIKTATDLFQKLTREYRRCKADCSSADHAINFCTTAHHLYVDWLRNELDAASYGKLKNEVDQRISVEVGIVRDICDGSKHLILDRRPHVQISDSNVHHGGFSNAFSLGFDVDGLSITLKDGSSVYFDQIADTIFDFWKHYFDSIK